MVSTLNLQEKYSQVQKTTCFYLDIQDHGLARTLSRRLQDMGLQQDVFLTGRVTHVVREGAARARAPPRCARRDAGRARADAMLERVRADHTPQSDAHAHYCQLTVQKAVALLDRLYDTFFTAPRKANVRLFSKHFIKIEFLDKVCRPVFKEFDEWPEISLEPNPPKEKKKESPENQPNNFTNSNIAGQKMTRKNRPRIKEKEEKEQKGGYCEMCNTEYVDATLHRRSAHHLAFVRDHTNFLALDSLITAGADVTTFLDKAAPLNGERRSLRKALNGDLDPPKTKRTKRSQSPDSTVNGNHSPRRNGTIDDEKKHNTRCSKKVIDSQTSEDRQYYKVVGVSTKLRSSGNFPAKRKDSPPTCNGAKPLVVKFRKVRRSELSVLSDEAEQFMFPKRASSTSSTSDEDDDDQEEESPSTRRRKESPPPPPPTLERKRLARPLALKEESSEEDSWPEDKRRRKRRVPPSVARRSRRGMPLKPPEAESQEPPPDPEPKPEPDPDPPEPPPVVDANPLREEPSERCMKWEDGRLKYTPAVEQLEFAFESVPHSEPWYETFKRQDQDKFVTRNVPKYFALYSKSPKLPYEIGQLPPLKPNCCPLSELVKRPEEKAGPSRSYGTRGMKQQKLRRRTAALAALEGRPRKSPREHASTLAMLGSAGLLQSRKLQDDSKSTASEETVSDAHSHSKPEPVLSEAQEASERLQQFLSELFEDGSECELSDDVMEGEAAVTTSTNVPDVLSLVSECDDCDLIRNEIKAETKERRARRGKFKKKNRTGWPNKKKVKKTSRTNSEESEQKVESSLDRSSAEPPDEDTADTVSDHDHTLSETEDKTLVEEKSKSDDSRACESMEVDDEKALQLNVKVVPEKDKIKEKQEKRSSRSSGDDDEKVRKRKRGMAGLAGGWLQPVVRVARVDPAAARRLRSAARTRPPRSR